MYRMTTGVDHQTELQLDLLEMRAAIVVADNTNRTFASLMMDGLLLLTFSQQNDVKPTKQTVSIFVIYNTYLVSHITLF